MGRTEDLRVVPGDVIPAHVICNEHDNMGRLRRDNDTGHQEAEEVGEHHGGQSGLLQHQLASSCPADNLPYLQTGWQPAYLIN